MGSLALAAIVLCALGYAFMVIDFRAYLRSLRRHLMRVYYRWDVPEWAVAQTPRCLAALGLRMPCTEDDVLRAYRQRVKELHPDRGGDRQRFLRIQTSFEQSLELVRKHQAGRKEVV
jgi:hypothetical protein